MEFKDKVKTVRRQLFLSQDAFAKAIGVSFVTVNRWENGKTEPNYAAQKKFQEFCDNNNVRWEKE